MGSFLQIESVRVKTRTHVFSHNLNFKSISKSIARGTMEFLWIFILGKRLTKDLKKLK